MAHLTSHKIGASGIHDGAVDTHRNGASDTPDWRDWHSLNTLALGLNHKKNTPTTTDADGEPDSEASRHNREGGGGHGMEFIGFARTKPNKRKNQELLLENGLTAQAFVSWLLYAASTSGNGIRDPIAHAVSRLIPDPSRGAGGAFDQLPSYRPTSWRKCLSERSMDKAPGTRPGEKQWKVRRVRVCGRWQIN
jgi:hypothetical protein